MGLSYCAHYPDMFTSWRAFHVQRRASMFAPPLFDEPVDWGTQLYEAWVAAEVSETPDEWVKSRDLN